MLAIVLSGGGAKGSYEIGVWKALRKNRIKFDIVTGTSVGALNGVMMVQGNYHYATKVWRKIDQSKILERENFKNRNEMIKFYAKSGLRGGTEVNGLENIMANAINERKFFKSKINFGIVTFNLSKMKHLELKKENIKKGYLKDYVIASATCFPFFKRKKVNDDNYIDGGYYDNLPINLAAKMGANDIIAVDLKAVGIKRKVENKNLNITYISPINDTGDFLDFNENNARRNIKLGYNDTMKKFNKLDGIYYTFKRKNLEKFYKKYYTKFYKNVLNVFGNINEKSFFKSFIDDENNNYFYNIIEECGKIYNIDEANVYKVKKFNKLIIKKLEKEDEKKSFFDSKKKIKEIMELLENNSISKIKRKNIIFHKEVIMAIYLYTIK